MTVREYADLHAMTYDAARMFFKRHPEELARLGEPTEQPTEQKPNTEHRTPNSRTPRPNKPNNPPNTEQAPTQEQRDWDRDVQTGKLPRLLPRR